MSLSLADCSPDSLASWLLEHRFNHDQSAVTNFLLESISNLPDANEISEFLVSAAVDFGVPLLAAPFEISAIKPKVKLTITCYDKCLYCEDKNRQSMILANAQYLVVFPRPEDCQPRKVRPPDFVLVVLESAVMYKNKPITQVCFQLPKEFPQQLNRQQQLDEDLDHSDSWTRILTQSLQAVRTVVRVVHPQAQRQQPKQLRPYQFASYQEPQTSTTHGGMPFVKCYMGATMDGALYPLPGGLLFFKPPLFLPRSELVSIQCDRSQGGSRYANLVVVKEGDAQPVEFSNISRVEMDGLNDYVHKTLIPAMKKDIAEDDDIDGALAEVELLAGHNEDDVVAVAEETEPSARGSAKRKASLEARLITKKIQQATNQDDDDEDDDDFDAGSGSDENDDNSSSESSSADDED
jgi:hypothetical protein